MEYEVWTDGSCIKEDERDSKGECGAGYVIVEKDSGNILHLHGEYIGITTNNMAEFVAVELALDDLVARNLGPSVHILIVSDSKMVVKEGDEVKVKVIGFDRGKVKLSIKQV